MVAVADVRRLYAYNWSVYDAYLDRMERLPWKLATQDLGSGHRSFKDTMVHILNVHDVWLNYVVPGRMRELERAKGRQPNEIRSWTEVRAYRDRVRAGIDPFLRRLRAADLRRPVKAPWMPGRYTLEDVFLQTTLEQAHHLGEVIALLWQREIEPPDMTWIDIRRGAARRPMSRRHRAAPAQRR
jgi:uncharacterized damage-inducible protein DinB